MRATRRIIGAIMFFGTQGLVCWLGGEEVRLFLLCTYIAISIFTVLGTGVYLMWAGGDE
jgi:hypothetical protein